MASNTARCRGISEVLYPRPSRPRAAALDDSDQSQRSTSAASAFCVKVARAIQHKYLLRRNVRPEDSFAKASGDLLAEFKERCRIQQVALHRVIIDIVACGAHIEGIATGQTGV